MNYIGMDTHISTLDFAVVNDRGELKKAYKIKTSAKGLIHFLQSVPKPRKLFIEEGCLAGWVVETCYAFGENVVVTDPKRNRWIGPIHSAAFSGILENPHRFSKKSKIWKYAGFAKMKKGSGGKTTREKLTKNYNRILKYTIKQAVQAAIKAKKNPIRDQYLELTLVKKSLPIWHGSPPVENF